MLNRQNITSEQIEAIYNQVISNSAEDSYWFGVSNMLAGPVFKERGYSYLNDDEIKNLCIEASNEAERCSDNLSARIVELSAEVERELPLEEEISRMASSGPLADENGNATKLFTDCGEWVKKHNYIAGSVRRKEFVLVFLRGCLKERSLTQSEYKSVTVYNSMTIHNDYQTNYSYHIELTHPENQTQRVEPEEKIPSQILELFKIPLSRNKIRVSDSPLVDEKGFSSYRFIALCSVASLMDDWCANIVDTDIPPTKLICEWVYAEGKDKKYHPVKKKTVDNYR